MKRLIMCEGPNELEIMRILLQNDPCGLQRKNIPCGEILHPAGIRNAADHF